MKRFCVQATVDVGNDRAFYAEMARNGRVKFTIINRESGLHVNQDFWLNRDEVVKLRDALAAHLETSE